MNTIVDGIRMPGQTLRAFFFFSFFLVVVKKAKTLFDMVLRVFYNLSFCFGVIVFRV